MRCGRRVFITENVASRPHGWDDPPGMLRRDREAAYWLGRYTRNLRRPPSVASPFRVGRQRPDELSCVSTCSSATAHAGRSNRRPWELRTSLAAPARSVGFFARRRCEHVAPSAGPDRAPLMRFCPLQHSPAAPRCPGLPASGRSRFGVSISTASVIAARVDDRPCGFSQKRRRDARRSGRWTCGGERSSQSTPRTSAVVKRATSSHPSSSTPGASVIHACDHALIGRPTCQAAPARFRRPMRVMHRRASFARCSATRLGHARPGRTSRVLPSWTSDGAHGVALFAGLVPIAGGHAARPRRLNDR